MDRRQRQTIPVAHRAADHDEPWHREGHRPWPAPGRQQYDGHTVHANLPLTLGDAAAAFNNQVIRGALAPDLAHQYTEVKSDEWVRACGAVTHFDREM